MSSEPTSLNLNAVASAAFAPAETAINDRRIPGAVLGIVHSSGSRSIVSAGSAQITPVKREMTDDTWFDLASLTKVIFTTPRILWLSEEGAIDLDAPISSVLVDLRQYDADCWERKVTFRECLGHRTPFPAVEPLYTYGRDPDLLRAFILQRRWRKEFCVYSDINFIFLGLVLERLTGKRIRQMDCGTGFAFSANPDQSAATEDCTWRHRVLCGEVHDDNCYALEGAGHAGLFGTAGAVLDYAHKLLTATGVLKTCVDLQRAALSSTRTHGWERSHPGWSGGVLCSGNTIGHTGFTGTGLWVDFERNIAWTLLTNRIHPTRHTHSGIDTIRKSVGDAVSHSLATHTE